MTERATSGDAAGGLVPASRTRLTTAGPRGTNRAAERIEREAAARRALFVASVAGVVGVFGLIAASEAPQAAGGGAPVGVTSPASGKRVLAEVPIGPLADGDARQTVVRIVAADAAPATAHVRTRAS